MKHTLIISLLLLAFGCSTSHGAKTSGVKEAGDQKTDSTTGTLWDFIPRGAAAILMVDFRHMPKSARVACGALCAIAAPVKKAAGPHQGITAWYPRGALLHAWSFGNPGAAPKNAATHRDIPLVIRGESALAYYPGDFLVWGSTFRVRLALDLRKGIEGTGARVSRDFSMAMKGIVGGITPSGIFVFRAKEPLTPLLKILAGGTPPLRGALALRFPPGWTTLTGVMEFPSIGMAEAFIAKLRARLASALAASPMKNYPWLAVLHPLSIHPEGRNVYIQWAARLEIFNTLLTATRPLLSRLRAELAGLTP